MKKIILFLAALTVATGANALSNMEKTAIDTMRRNGASDACIAKMTRGDATFIYSTMNDGDTSPGNKNRRIKDKTNQICAR
ncbi:hypothetical protein [Aliiruegeria lutimaris]|uniref:Uncharacterized protein n=1 Tax=Aliiruegeria lutimaris TaxID=571298 RepID=A0A1G8IP71_9RHOB|nr:hypothetical protein [Aliiruegeria lutimaris]SDI20715.1 hypothetical protein SAMN04488026_100190 [Aliiruegeria lutimaris]